MFTSGTRAALLVSFAVVASVALVGCTSSAYSTPSSSPTAAPGAASSATLGNANCIPSVIAAYNAANKDESASGVITVSPLKAVDVAKFGVPEMGRAPIATACLYQLDLSSAGATLTTVGAMIGGDKSMYNTIVSNMAAGSLAVSPDSPDQYQNTSNGLQITVHWYATDADAAAEGALPAGVMGTAYPKGLTLVTYV